MDRKKVLLISFLTLLPVFSFLTGKSLYAQNKPSGGVKTDKILLLTRADDMGNSFGRTLGIIRAHREGIITSAGIMPTSPFFEESVQLCKANPTLVMGIHLTLLGTRTRSVLSPELIPSILTKEGFFYETLDQLNNANPSVEEMEKEILAQIGKVRATGLNFVYLDWHRSVPEPIKGLIEKLCHEQKLVYGQDYQKGNGSEYGYTLLPLLPESWPTQKTPDGQISYYAAPSFTPEQQKMFLDRLSEMKPGKWMLMAHPGMGEPQRISVTELLCSPETKEIIKRKNIQLVSYYDIWREEFGKATVK